MRHAYLLEDSQILKHDGRRTGTRTHLFSSYKKAFAYVVAVATNRNPRKIEKDTPEEVYKDEKGYQGGYFLLIDREDDKPVAEITIKKELIQ